MKRDDLQENMMLVDMLQEDEIISPDSIDFNWWDDFTLLEFSLNYDRTKELDPEVMQSLIYELARRLDDYVNGDETDED